MLACKNLFVDIFDVPFPHELRCYHLQNLIRRCWLTLARFSMRSSPDCKAFRESTPDNRH